MIELKEALINKKTMHRVHPPSKKDKLEDGDIVLTQNELFLIYFSEKTIRKFFPLMISNHGYKTKVEDGLFVKPTAPTRNGDYRFSYNFIECAEYDNDLKRSKNPSNDIVKVYKNALYINHSNWDEIYLDYTNLVAKNK